MVPTGLDFGFALGAVEQPRLPAKGEATQHPFGGVVGQADSAVVAEAGEGRPAGQHVVDRLLEDDIAHH